MDRKEEVLFFLDLDYRSALYWQRGRHYRAQDSYERTAKPYSDIAEEVKTVQSEKNKENGNGSNRSSN